MQWRIAKALLASAAVALALSASPVCAQEAIPGVTSQPGVNLPVGPVVPPASAQIVVTVPNATPVVTISTPRAAAPTGPITVEQAVKLALDNNTSYQIALDRVVRAKAVVVETKGQLLGPKLGANATITEQKEVTASFGPTQSIVIVPATTALVQLGLTQPIDITGVLRAGVDIARLQETIQEVDLRRVRQQIVSDTRTTFYTLIRGRQIAEVDRQALAAAEDHLRVVRQQLDAGTAPQFDVLRAEVQVANFRQAYLAAQNFVSLAEASMNVALGTPGGTKLQVAEPPIPATQNPDIDASIATAQKTRPEVLETQLNIEIAQRGVVVAKRGLLPSFALSSNFQANPQPSALGSSTNWNVTAALSVPIYDAGVTPARVREARIDVDISRINLVQLCQTIALEVRQSVVNLQDAQERLSSSQANLNQAREALRLANVRFQAGVSTQVEVTDAQVATSQAETNYVNALNDVRQALARYERAIGTPV